MNPLADRPTQAAAPPDCRLNDSERRLNCFDSGFACLQGERIRTQGRLRYPGHFDWRRTDFLFFVKKNFTRLPRNRSETLGLIHTDEPGTGEISWIYSA